MRHLIEKIEAIQGKGLDENNWRDSNFKSKHSSKKVRSAVDALVDMEERTGKDLSYQRGSVISGVLSGAIGKSDAGKIVDAMYDMSKSEMKSLASGGITDLEKFVAKTLGESEREGEIWTN